MRVQKTKVYKFDELSDKAKEKARDWYRSCQDGDNYFAESVIEDAATIADIIGIDLRSKPVKLMGGGTRYEPCVWWSGFSHQGQGASYEGTYSYAKGSVKRLKEHAPQDKELHRIVEGLADMQRKCFYRMSVNISTSGQEVYAEAMRFEDTSDLTAEQLSEDYGAMCELLRDFAHWIYRQLEQEWDYQNTDEQVDESIQANEYEFDEDGVRV